MKRIVETNFINKFQLQKKKKTPKNSAQNVIDDKAHRYTCNENHFSN